jgi:hypothetical protein
MYSSCTNRRIYIFVRVEVSNNFTCASLKKNKSLNALYAGKNLGVTSTNQAKNGVLRVCSAAYAISKRPKSSHLNKKISLIFAQYAKKSSVIIIIRTDTSLGGSGKWSQVHYCVSRAIKKRMQTITKS